MPTTVNQDDCSGCGECVEVCPTEAIEMNDDKASVDPDACGDCGVCEDACPTGAITIE